MKRSNVKKISYFLIPFVFVGVVASGSGCATLSSLSNKDKVKLVASKIALYSSWAEAVIEVAQAYVGKSDKVKKALAATTAALVTLRKLAVAVSAGLTADDDATLLTAVTSLIASVFELQAAIQEAKAAS